MFNNIEYVFRREWKIKRLKIDFSWRSKNNAWGRFGGGWNWKFGFSIGTSTIIVHLLVADLSLRISK